MVDAAGLRRHDRVVTLGGLVAVTALSWAYLLWASTGAHGDMSHPPPVGIAPTAADGVSHAAGEAEEEEPDVLP